MSKLYVGNLPRTATESSLEEFFQAAQYQVESIKLIRDMDTGVPRGFAFVELAAGVDVEKAIQELNGQTIEGRQLIINEARPQSPRIGEGGGGGGGRRFANRPRHGGGGGGGRGRGGGGGGRKRFSLGHCLVSSRVPAAPATFEVSSPGSTAGMPSRVATTGASPSSHIAEPQTPRTRCTSMSDVFLLCQSGSPWLETIGDEEPPDRHSK